jgi:hypothetical protein
MYGTHWDDWEFDTNESQIEAQEMDEAEWEEYEKTIQEAARNT